MTHEQLTKDLVELGLNKIAKEYVEMAKVAGKKSNTYEQYLGFLTKLELESKAEIRTQRLIKEAKLPRAKRVETFVWKDREGITQEQFNRLATGQFLKDATNIVFYGDFGVGKSHLAEALVVKLCAQGKKCHFTSTHALIEQMVEAKKNLTLTQLLKRIDRFELLVMDELGFLPQTIEGADLLFQLISQRDERRSTMITTNLTFSEWNKVFVNPLSTAAAIDRIIHKCETFNIQGPSWRAEIAKKRKSNSVDLTSVEKTSTP